MARFVDFEVMLADLTRAAVVFVGEQHDDPATHRLEAAVLEGVARRGRPAVVSLEMFERDVQGAVDAYLSGRTDEDAFLKASRPWPRYATDYRLLVEFAKANRWPVIASNTPRRHASAVAKAGLEALGSLERAERAFVAGDIDCPRDEYFDRFVVAMKEHPAPGSEAKPAAERDAMTERTYHAQCIKDETMAESIAALRPSTDRPVVHFNGAFHSDFGLGAAARTRRRLPETRVVVVSMIPTSDDLATLAPSDEDRRRADYLVFTIRAASANQPPRTP